MGLTLDVYAFYTNALVRRETALLLGLCPVEEDVHGCQLLGSQGGDITFASLLHDESVNLGSFYCLRFSNLAARSPQLTLLPS